MVCMLETVENCVTWNLTLLKNVYLNMYLAVNTFGSFYIQTVFSYTRGWASFNFVNLK